MNALDRRAALKLAALAVLAPNAWQLAACSASGAAGEGTQAAKPGAPSSYTIDNIRDYVVGLDELVELEDGSKRQAICFDNAATTPALVPVLDEVAGELALYGSIGRGFSQKSDHSAEVYSSTREKVLSFLGADPAPIPHTDLTW